MQEERSADALAKLKTAGGQQAHGALFPQDSLDWEPGRKRGQNFSLFLHFRRFF